MDTNTNYNPQEGGSGTKKAMSIIGVIMLLASVSAYAFLVRPFMDDYNTIKVDITSKAEKVAKLENTIKTFKDTETKMDLTTEVQKTTLISSIPVGMNQDSIIEGLIKVADENDIQLKSVSFGNSRGDETKVGVVKINASFEGNYNDLLNFLKGIEEHSRFFKVSSINVQLSDVPDMEIKRVTFSLSMDAYYQ